MTWRIIERLPASPFNSRKGFLIIYNVWANDELGLTEIVENGHIPLRR